jgi:pimeloyl-ACP methyl ester carboxylesterase
MAADVVAIADHLNIERFAVAGVSAGGVHAFAVAALHPQRITRCVGVKAMAPYRATGLDFFAGMDPADADGLRQLVGGDRDALTANAEGTRAWVESGCPGITAPEPVAAMLRLAFNEAFRRGVDGYVDDWLAQFAAHGFELESVTAPTLLLAAKDDQQVPPGHGRWLADQLPNAELIWVEGGHLDTREDDELRAFHWAGHEAAAR